MPEINDNEILKRLRDITKNKEIWKLNVDYVAGRLNETNSMSVKAKSLWLLGEMGLKYPTEIEKHVSDIANYLGEDNPKLRERSVNALGRIGRADINLVINYMDKLMEMKDDESEIALLKSSGFGNGTTGLWQFLRMMILVVIGMVLSVIITPTLVAYLLGAAFNMMIGITGFTFTRGVGLSFLWVVFIILVIGAVVALVLKKIDKIEIGRIRNE